MTQYDAVAEIEAMKARRQHRHSADRTHRVRPASLETPSWTSAGEEAIRAEMERRITQRAVGKGAKRAR